MNTMTLTLNQSLFLWMNHAAAVVPDWLWASLTISAHTSMVFAFFSLLLLLKFERRDIITALFVTALLGGVVSVICKETFQVMRPPAVFSANQFHLIGHKLDLVSFPSGHTLSAFAIATLLALGFQLRGWRLAGVFGLAALLGLSRIAVGAHWPLDVVGGAVLGTLCGYIGWRIALIVHRKAWTQSVIYSSCQNGIIGLVSLSLFATDMGYPDAIFWQMGWGIIGGLSALYSLLLLLKSIKLSLKG